VLSAMPLARAAEVLDEPGLEAAAELVEAQPPDRAIALLTALSADQRADIFRHLDAPTRERLLTQLDPETTASLAQLLAYPENTGVRWGAILLDRRRDAQLYSQGRKHARDHLCDLPPFLT
jgi:Mg/Co/Ni transporter MgtE